MRLEIYLLVAAAASAAVGFFHVPRVAHADPAACQKYKCKTVHAFWSEVERPSYASAHHKVGLTDNHNAYRVNIFTQTSTGTDDSLPRDGNYDMWVWDDCSPQCGKSIPSGDGAVATWQAEQEVARGGNGDDVPGLLNEPRYLCLSADGTGPLASSQTNPNSGGLSPPGN